MGSYKARCYAPEELRHSTPQRVVFRARKFPVGIQPQNHELTTT